MSDSEKPNRQLEKEGHQTQRESLSPQGTSDTEGISFAPLTPVASRGIRSELSCLGLRMNRKSVLPTPAKQIFKECHFEGMPSYKPAPNVHIFYSGPEQVTFF